MFTIGMCHSNVVIVINSGEKPFECDHGDITTVLNSKLTSHQITHIEKKPCKCEECDEGFVQKVDLVWNQCDKRFV